MRVDALVLLSTARYSPACCHPAACARRPSHHPQHEDAKQGSGGGSGGGSSWGDGAVVPVWSRPQVVAHHLEFDAGLLCEELSRVPALRQSRPLVAALARTGICTMTTAAKRIGLRKKARTDGTFYYSPSLPRGPVDFLLFRIQ